MMIHPHPPPQTPKMTGLHWTRVGENCTGGGGSSFTRSPAWARGFLCTVLVTAHLPALTTGFQSVRVRQLLAQGLSGIHTHAPWAPLASLSLLASCAAHYPLNCLPLAGPDPEPPASHSPAVPARLPLRHCPLVCLVPFPLAVTRSLPSPFSPPPPSPLPPIPPSHWCRYTAYGTGGVGGWGVGEAASSGWVSETDLPYCGVGNITTIP